MNKTAFLQILIGIMVIAGIASAQGCAESAYLKACMFCSFDADGNINQSCLNGYQGEGKACVSTAYPVMAGQYAAGKCPEVDACAQELSSCTAQYSTGNDKQDCRESSVQSCYTAADYCTKDAAKKCGDVFKTCPGSSAFLIMLLLGAGYISVKARS